MTDSEHRVKQELLEQYKTFVDMLGRYPVEIILKVLKDKIKEYEKDLKDA